MTSPLSTLPIADWPRYLSGLVLVMIRISGVMVFAPFFSSEAIPVRVKTVFVLAFSILLAPVVSVLPLSRAELGPFEIIGELSVGLIFGLQLSLLNEILLFCGQVLGFQFSFSLVNLLDPDAPIQVPLLSQMFSLMGTMVLLASGLHRDILFAFLRSFQAVPVGAVILPGNLGLELVKEMGGVFFAALQLAAPVMAATILAEVAVGALGKLSPQLPVMVVSVPAKTMLGYISLIGSLALWPHFLEGRFSILLDRAEFLVRHMVATP
jgi:flagellar biosynthesis protein FliR